MPPRTKSLTRGFSLIEPLVAVSMALVLTTMAVPSVIGSLNSVKLRSAAGDLGGLLQKTRMMAVASNRTYPVRSSGSVLYADLNNNSTLDTAEQINSLQLPRGVVFDSDGPAISLGFSASVLGLPGFDPRGLPCTPTATVCTSSQGTGTGFYYYLRQDGSFTTPGWAAVSVSPAGRIKVWIWSGSTWQ